MYPEYAFIPSVAMIPNIATTTKSSIKEKPSLLVFIKKLKYYSIVTLDSPVIFEPEQGVT